MKIQFRVKVTGILAETMEDAITKAEANLSEEHLKSAEWTEGTADCYAVVNNGADVGKAPGNDSFLLAAGWQLANGYTKTILPGAVFMRRLGGSGTKFASYDLTIVQAETGEWIPVHGMVKMHAVATPQEAADALMNHWHNLPDADKLASIATDRTT